MVCKSCGAPFEDSSPVCPYCGWENAAVAEQQQQQQLQGIFARIANLLQLPQRTAERTTRFLKKAGRYILLVFAAALVLALAFSVLAPRFQLRKQQQNLQQLESYYTARDYDALYAMMDGLDDGYRAVYQKYDITAELYHSVLYLRQYADLFAAGAVEEGLCDGMLFGRMAFADPDFANEIMKQGRIDPRRVCMTCGKCGDLIRSHLPTGCVVRDPQTFLPFYQAYMATVKDLPANFRG